MPALYALLIFLCLVIPLELRAYLKAQYIESYRLHEITVRVKKRPERYLPVARECGRGELQVDRWLACRDRIRGGHH